MKRRSQLVETAKRKTFRKRYRLCEFEGCAKRFLSIRPTHRFCGSVQLKRGCAFLNQRLNQYKWRKKHPELVAKWRKNWNAAHPELVKFHQRAKYERHRAEYLLKSKRRYERKHQDINKRRRDAYWRAKGKKHLGIDKTLRYRVPIV